MKYFNYSYKRTGTLWEGRYRSSLVQEDGYLLKLYRYIELNPVRAGMVTEPSEYSWSSYRINALAAESELCAPHAQYLALGADRKTRQVHYRELFRSQLDTDLITDIRKATNSGLALGNDIFKAQIEYLTGRKQTPAKRGRKPGWQKEQA